MPERIAAPPPFELLDSGCGPGRDLATFTALGHRATGLEGSAPMAALARPHGGCRVLEQNILALALPPDHLDGIFANAALFHVHRQALPRVRRELHATLKAGGVLLNSNPRGNGEEGVDGDRYRAYFNWETWRGLMTDAGFDELTHYYQPSGLPWNSPGSTHTRAEVVTPGERPRGATPLLR